MKPEDGVGMNELRRRAMRFQAATRWLSAGVIVGVASWAVYAGIAWVRYGQAKRPAGPGEADPLLDQFMPMYEIADRHHARVAASSGVTFAAATAVDLQQSPVIRAIFKGREWILGGEPQANVFPRPLLAWAKAMGWGILAEVPGREVVVGAVTKPWEANVVFRALAADQFAAFHEPGYVKIAWTLRADPLSATETVIRTETRVTTTGSAARAKFRRYWAFLSPGIRLIRRIALRIARREAELTARGKRKGPRQAGMD
jgi:hypothetical protein